MSVELDQTADDPDAASRPTALAPGSSLGKYKLERVLGEGGMGVVWSARDPDLQRLVALKVLKHAHAAQQLRQRLLREAVAMAKLKHPNVLTVYEVGTVGDRDFIAMELVEGTTLDDWLSARPPLEEVWTAILAAGRGLAAAHAAGVVHRDFKPHNVLRSRNGRVLVTDFGLARGVLDEGEGAEADPHPAGDQSVLDTPLTQTGAVIGTPAYMAPEQFHGQTPDPRTDQFAFAVTAWQAFTGQRPFTGTTLDELKQAVDKGVSAVTLGPPRAIRAVLARGLDPKPDARWASLEDLLDALVSAERLPRRRMRLYAIGGAAALLVAAVGIAMMLRPSTVPNACDAPDRLFAEAWSPTVRSALQRTANTPAFDRVATAFDQFQEKWVVSYQKACRSRKAASFPARVQCLEGVADQVSALTVMLRSAPPMVFERFDAGGVFPHLTACERTKPQAPPALPRTEPLRGKVLATYSKLFGIVTAPRTQLETVSTALEREAQATGYQPLVATVIVMTADTQLRYGDVAAARATYKRALPVTRAANDHRLEARVHIGILEAAIAELGEPGAKSPPKLDDPRAQPELHPELVKALTAARSAVNDDALLLGSVEMVTAAAYMQVAQWNRYRTAYSYALTRVQEARKQFESLPDVRRAAQAAALEGEIYLARGDERALSDAKYEARRASDALDSAGMPTLPALEMILRKVEFAARDYKEVHRIADRQAAQEVSNVATTISGTVSPPGPASIVAWRGDLVGDPRRAYIDANVHAFATAQASSDGRFTINAEPGWVVIAELADTRSLPQAIGKGALHIKLQPTVTQSGTARGKNLLGVRAFAEYRVGESSWTLHVPLEREGMFDLRGMPAGGTPSFGTTGEAGHATRVVRAPSSRALSWPAGQAVEVIVRSKQITNEATVWVFAGGLPSGAPLHGGGSVVETSVRTRAELESLVGSDVAIAPTSKIGASNTDAGREHYRPGDRHAVVTGNADGVLSACAAASGAPEARVSCKTFRIETSVVIDYPDGRHAAGVTPVVIEP